MPARSIDTTLELESPQMSESSVFNAEPTVVLHLTGSPTNRYFRIGPLHVKRLGLMPHPDREYELMLQEGADPNAAVELPNGVVFTAHDLTTLSSKSGDAQRGWEIWTDDPGGFPSEV